MDFTIFTTAEAWISLLTLTFLEIVLGVDNIVFITITSNRLPKDKQHIGRRLGLIGALAMRCLFLCFASWLVHLSNPLFTIDIGFYQHGISIRDLVMLVGGGYLVYKGIRELVDMLGLKEIKEELVHEGDDEKRGITLPQAVGTIMVMDIVFSIDSVITAVGLAEHLIVMILAVIIAVILMMVLIDWISEFINENSEMKILALVFITAIGLLLVFDSLGITTHIEVLDMHLEKFLVYCAMVFAVVLELIQMRYNSNLVDFVRANPELARKGAFTVDSKSAQLKSGVALADAEISMEEAEENYAEAEGSVDSATDSTKRVEAHHR